MIVDSWSRRIARVCIRPLIGSPVTPNHLTTIRLLTGITACVAFAVGLRAWDIWGGILWVLSVFLDYTDGELARQGGTSSASGHAYDYAVDVAVNGLVFIGIGIGLRDSSLGNWAILLGLLAGVTIIAASLLSESLEKHENTGDEKAYEGFAGFDFDDVLYLFGPIAWMNWLLPLLIGAAIGGPVFALITWWRLSRL